MSQSMQSKIDSAYAYLIWIPPMAIGNEDALYWTGQATYSWPSKAVVTKDIRKAELFRSTTVALLMKDLFLFELGSVKTLTNSDKKMLSL